MRKLVFAIAVLYCSILFASAQTYLPNYRDGAIWLKLKPAEEFFTKKKEKLSLDDVRVLKPLKEKYKLKEVDKPFRNIRKTSPLQNTYLLTFDNIHEADKLIKELEKSGVLEYAEKVPLDKPLNLPTDSLYGSQWNLNKINAPGAWSLHTSAANTVIAIVDDAVQTTHPDLAPNIWVNPGEIPGNNTDDDGNGYPDDVNGWDFASNDNNPNPTPISLSHGTHVAGIASAATNNGVKGVASIGYNARLMCIKTTDEPNYVKYGYAGILYAADNGANVINLSWGGPEPSITAQNIINYALDKGCIIVAAAGNDNKESVSYPAGYAGVVSVAATNSNDKKAWFSNYGSAVTISAPGDGILSTTVGNGYGYSSGTSMASPLVAGLLALMHSYNPSMPNSQLINCLRSTARKLDELDPTYAGRLGAGRIDAAAAMQCVGPTLSYMPTADFATKQTKIRAGTSIIFNDSSAYATAWSWSFPGSTTPVSTARNPIVTYNTPGTYNVSLTVSNNNGSDIETKSAYITVGNAGTCLGMNMPDYTQGEDFIRVDDDGEFANGVSSKGKKQKAVYIDGSAVDATHVSYTMVWFSRASSADPNKMITARIYDGTSGTPGSLLGSASLAMGDIMSDVTGDYFSYFEFPSYIELPASKKYFVSIDYSSLCYDCPTPDELNIVSNFNDASTPATIWEQWQDNSWHRYGTAGSLPYNDSIYIIPVVTNYPVVSSIIPSSTELCKGGSVFFDGSGSSYESGFEWTFRYPNNTVEYINDQIAPRVTLDTEGQFQVSLLVQGGGCNELAYTTVTINVKENVTPTVTLTSSTTEPGVPVTFTAVTANAGPGPVYTFKKNSEVVQTGTTNTWNVPALNSSDQVSCILTPDYSCVTTTTVYSNSITMDATLTTLPVELLFFKGNTAGGVNQLQWATTSETNTAHFIVERSIDGSRFSVVGKVNAKGESNTTVEYRFDDKWTNAAYYRLRIVDLDGSYEFSQVVYLVNSQGKKLVIWPSPATTGQEVQLVLTNCTARQETVRVTDAYGKVMFRETVAVKGGRLETVIPTVNLAAGIYFITITDEINGKVQQEKLVIIR